MENFSVNPIGKININEEEKAKKCTATFDELNTQIKTAEKRMAEIGVLKKHIINYAQRPPFRTGTGTKGKRKITGTAVSCTVIL